MTLEKMAIWAASLVLATGACGATEEKTAEPLAENVGKGIFLWGDSAPASVTDHFRFSIGVALSPMTSV